MRRFVALALILGSSLGHSTAKADPDPDEAAARLEFLETRIANQRYHAEIWWKGWLTFYTMGAVVQGVRASRATDPIDQADLWISMAKSMGGVVRMVADPYGGIHGLEPIVGYGGEGPRTLQLQRAERVLQHNAARTNPFGPWWAHFINLGVNGLGAVIVGAGYDGWRQGLISGAIGFGVGELVILSGPWEADSDREQYSERFPSWRLEATSHGGAFALQF